MGVIEMQIDWNDEVKIRKAIKDANGRVQAMKNLGYSPKGSITRKKLNEAIEKFNIDISHFTCRTDRWNVLPDKINECYCISDVLRAVGLLDRGNNHLTAKRAIRQLNLDTSHFNRDKGGSISPYNDEDIFCEDSLVHQSTLKNRVLKNELIPYECDECSITEWNGQALSLQLDHINGINNDNRLTNLRFLCPNCHSLTSTFGGKNNLGV